MSETENNTCELPHPRLKAGKVTAKEITILREIIEAIHDNGSTDVRGVVEHLDNKSTVESQMKKIAKDAPDEAPIGLYAVPWSLTDAEKALNLHENEDDQALFKTCISMLKTAKIVRQLGRGRGQALILLTDGFIHVESNQSNPYEFCHGIDIPGGDAWVAARQEEFKKKKASLESEPEETEVDEQEDEQEFYPDGQPVPPPPGDDDMPPETVEIAQADINSMQKQLETLVKVSSEQTKEYQALQTLVREAIQQNAAEEEELEEDPTAEVISGVEEAIDEMVDEDDDDDTLLPSIHSF